MTFRSESRGILYTAPPGPDEEDETGARADEENETAERPGATGADGDDAADVPERESTTPGTDADSTGPVLADD